MNKINNRAIIADNVNLGDNNTIGPNVIVEDGVTIGSDNVIGPGVVIFSGTTIGNENRIHTGAVIGDLPQDKAFADSKSFVSIGNKNHIREYVTIHRGTKPETTTHIGDDNFLMGYTHIAHNCCIGSGVVTVNTVVLGGYVALEDNSFISASVVIHQFCRVGAYAMVSGLSAVNGDVPPFMTAGGRPALVHGLNVVGLKRAGMKPPVRAEIKRAFKLLYRSGLKRSNALEEIKKQCSTDEVSQLTKFVEEAERGIVAGGRKDDITL